MTFPLQKRRRIITSDPPGTYQRLDTVRQLMTEHQLQALLVTELAHVRYLTGFTGSSGLCVITPTEQYFITDRRYKTQAPQEIHNYSILIAKQKLFPLIAGKKLIPARARVGFESHSLPVSDMESLRKLLPGRRFVPASNILESVTAIKDDGEIELIRTAARITDKVFQRILTIIKPGMREREVAAEISYYHQIYGAEGNAFDPIVAGGERAALPHARASENKIRKGDMVVLDFGCRYQGYHSDITRTISVGKPSAKMKKIYHIVLDAQKKAIEAVRSGVSARSIDSVARKYIRNQGFGRYFIHSTGHGLGIHVHEPLRVSALSAAILRTGNVITIEPGIYIPGSGGVRIEDDVAVHSDGSDVLTASLKELIIV